jgi:hypothetical protein
MKDNNPTHWVHPALANHRTDRFVIPQLPPLVFPLTVSNTQPLPPATLDVQSLLREILEGRIKPSVLKKV